MNKEFNKYGGEMESMSGSLKKPPLKPPGTGGKRPKPTADELIE